MLPVGEVLPLAPRIGSAPGVGEQVAFDRGHPSALAGEPQPDLMGGEGESGQVLPESTQSAEPVRIEQRVQSEGGRMEEQCIFRGWQGPEGEGHPVLFLDLERGAEGGDAAGV